MFIQQFFIICFLSISTLLPMELVEQKHINQLPDELFKTIVIQKHHKYPWENFIHSRRLGYVCKHWYAIVSDADQLAQELKIPPMHCAAMMNNADKFIDLKLAGHSPFAPDEQKKIPLEYAVSCKQPASTTIIKLLYHNFDISFFSKIELKFIKSLVSKSTITYTEEDLTNAVKEEDYDGVVTILFNNALLLIKIHLELVSQADSFKSDKLSKLFRYCIQSFLEYELFSRIDSNISIGDRFLINFVRYKANPNAYNYDGKTFLHCIARSTRRNHFLLDLFTLEGVDSARVDLVNGLNSLQTAVWYNNSECMDFLIKKGADSNCMTCNGETLLNLAACCNSLECLAYLIKLIPEQINIKNRYGYSPLINFLRTSLFPYFIRDLINAGADIFIKDNNGQTALHFAASKNFPEAINILIAHGADINCRSNADFVVQGINYGLYTPLHYAACKGSVRAMDVLLRSGADVTLKTQTGKTFGELLVSRLVEQDIKIV